jgi:hypothetical protein
MKPFPRPPQRSPQGGFPPGFELQWFIALPQRLPSRVTAMATVVFLCPNTGDRVQGRFADDGSGDRGCGRPRPVSAPPAGRGAYDGPLAIIFLRGVQAISAGLPTQFVRQVPYPMLLRRVAFPDFCEPCLPSQADKPPAGLGGGTK